MKQKKDCWFKRNIMGKGILLILIIIFFIPVGIGVLGKNLYKRIKRKKQ
jgi:hypothetical protein